MGRIERFFFFCLHADNLPRREWFHKDSLKLYNKVRLFASSQQKSFFPLAVCELRAMLERPKASFSEQKGFRHEQ
jgi:hypothetical protein